MPRRCISKLRESSCSHLIGSIYMQSEPSSIARINQDSAIVYCCGRKILYAGHSSANIMFGANSKRRHFYSTKYSPLDVAMVHYNDCWTLQQGSNSPSSLAGAYVDHMIRSPSHMQYIWRFDASDLVSSRTHGLT